jgi:hypothetical protein
LSLWFGGTADKTLRSYQQGEEKDSNTENDSSNGLRMKNE